MINNYLERVEEYKKKLHDLANQYGDVASTLTFIHTDYGYEHFKTSNMCICCVADILNEQIKEDNIQHIVPVSTRNSLWN